MREFRNAIRMGMKYFGNEGFVFYSPDRYFWWSMSRPHAYLDEEDWVIDGKGEAFYLGAHHRYMPPLLPWWEMVVDLQEHHEEYNPWPNQHVDRKGNPVVKEKGRNEYGEWKAI